MRIVIFGQAAFGENVLQRLNGMNNEIVGVYTSSDTPGRINPLKELAHQLKIPVYQPPQMHHPEVYGQYIKLRPDLNVMAFVTDILPLNILNYPTLGTIQYHPSLLPKHRGGSAINWAIIKGETRTGITIFWPNKGIDTGPILLQKEVAITPDDTVGSLYFEKLFPVGIDAIAESITLLKQGNAPHIPQDEAQATYEGLCTEKDAIIDWRQPTTKVYNLIRGTNPQPGATTCFHGSSLKIFDVTPVMAKANASAGEIVSITEQGFTVATADGAMLVKRTQRKGQPKIAACELAQQTGLTVGDKLG